MYLFTFVIDKYIQISSKWHCMNDVCQYMCPETTISHIFALCIDMFVTYVVWRCPFHGMYTRLLTGVSDRLQLVTSCIYVKIHWLQWHRNGECYLTVNMESTILLTCHPYQASTINFIIEYSWRNELAGDSDMISSDLDECSHVCLQGGHAL